MDFIAPIILALELLIGAAIGAEEQNPPPAPPETVQEEHLDG